MRRIPSVRRRCREHSRLCPSPGEQFPASPWSTRAGAPFPAAFQRLRPGTETDQDFLWDIFLIRNLNKKRQPWARCGDAPPSGRAPSLLQGSPGAGGRAGIPRNRCQPCASAPQPRSLALPPGILPHPGAPWPPPPTSAGPGGLPARPLPRGLSPCTPRPGQPAGTRSGRGFAFPGSSSRCRWRRSLHCVGRGRSGISWQEKTRRDFCGEAGSVGGREGDARHIPPRERILSPTSAWQNSALPLLKPGFDSRGRARQGKLGISRRWEHGPRAGSAARLRLSGFQGCEDGGAT